MRCFRATIFSAGAYKLELQEPLALDTRLHPPAR
jgi:hypothetical protein